MKKVLQSKAQNSGLRLEKQGVGEAHWWIIPVIVYFCTLSMMMTTKYEYQFPEKVPFRAMEVTKPDFYIQDQPQWLEKLWVDFSSVRGLKRFQRLFYELGIINGELPYLLAENRKVIFSGHRGSGKSVELRRFVDQLDQPQAYFVVFIDLEQEVSTDLFQPEDLFIVIITLLLRTLKERGIHVERAEFEALAQEWVQDVDVQKELKNTFGLEAGAEVSLGWKFWEFLGIGGNLKGTYSAENATTRTVRQKIKANPQGLVSRLNTALASVRAKIVEKGLGRDLIIVLDGFEKTKREVYDNLFLQQPQLILTLDVHMILTVPITTFYEIQSQSSKDFFTIFYLPMLRLEPNSIQLLEQIVTKRVDAALLDEGVLDLFIQYSGGCPRQLLKLVNRGLSNAIGQNVSMVDAEDVIREEGHERWLTLKTPHQEVLRKRHFNSADDVVLSLMFSLNLLEYNGSNPERKINPLIERFFPADADV
jgi:hypothetical protein